MDLTKTNCMIDTETLATDPDSVCLSIGAVKFDENGIIDQFFVNIDPSASIELGLKIDRDTLDWWKKQKPGVLKQATADAISPEEAIIKFEEWYGSKSIPSWAKGSAFDFPILESYYRALGKNKKWPWKYWHVKCFRTVADMFKEIEAPTADGDLHNALVDARLQAEHLIKIWKELASHE